MSFTFGTSASKFTPQTTSQPFSFSTNTSTVAKPTTGFSFGGTGFGLGSGSTTTTASSFGFGGLTSTSTTGGLGTFGSGFGTTSAGNTGFGLSFGTGQQQTSTGTLFGGFGQPQPQTFSSSFGGFGAKQPTGQLGFGTGFGASLVGQQPQQLQQPQSEESILLQAVNNCSLFGDERDAVLARFNLIQALWGSGRGYYAVNVPPIEFTPHNPLCRFKAVVYSKRVEPDESRECLVVLSIPKQESEVVSNQVQLVSAITQALGGRATVTISGIRSAGTNRTQVALYAEEQGTHKRCGAVELAAHLRQHLVSLGAESILPLLSLDVTELERYLETPPPGLDARLWKQAQLENPDPTKLIPVALVGFEALGARVKAQEREAKSHEAALDNAAEVVAGLQAALARTKAKCAEYRQKVVLLEHRVLKVIGRQQVRRRTGQALDPREEMLFSRLSALKAHFSVPSVVKARLNESLSQVRLRQGGTLDCGSGSGFCWGGDDLYKFLSMEQEGIGRLVDVVRADSNSMRIILDGLYRLLPSQYK